MTYANVVFHYGIEEFCARAAEVGMDGLILPDVPFEEKEEFAGPCRAHGMDLISMIAPTSEERIDTIARDAEGFHLLCKLRGVTRRARASPLISIPSWRVFAQLPTPLLPSGSVFPTLSKRQSWRQRAMALLSDPLS